MKIITPAKQINRLMILQRVMRSLRIKKAVNGVSSGAVNERTTDVEYVNILIPKAWSTLTAVKIKQRVRNLQSKKRGILQSVALNLHTVIAIRKTRIFIAVNLPKACCIALSFSFSRKESLVTKRVKSIKTTHRSIKSNPLIFLKQMQRSFFYTIWNLSLSAVS